MLECWSFDVCLLGWGHQQIVEKLISPYNASDRTASSTGTYNELQLVICSPGSYCTCLICFLDGSCNLMYSYLLLAQNL